MFERTRSESELLKIREITEVVHAVLTHAPSGTPITAGIDGTTVCSLCKVIYVILRIGDRSGQRELLSRSRTRVSMLASTPCTFHISRRGLP